MDQRDDRSTGGSGKGCIALVLEVVLMVVRIAHPARHGHLYARRQALANKLMRVGDIRRAQLV